MIDRLRAFLDKIGRDPRAVWRDFMDMTGRDPRAVWIERLLWAQIVLAALPAVAFAFWAVLDAAWLVPFLLFGEAILIGLALWGFKRRLSFAPWLYLAVSLGIFVEAVTMSGLASIVFKAEAVLSLIACYYVFAMRPKPRGEAAEG